MDFLIQLFSDPVTFWNSHTLLISQIVTAATFFFFTPPPGFGHPLVMHYLPDSNQLLVTDQGFPDGAPGAVQLVDCRDDRIVKTVKLPPGVDHAAFSAASD